MGKRSYPKRRKITKTTKPPAKKAAVVDIFETPSEDEDFKGFKSEPPTNLSEDSRDSVHSEDSGKADLCFRSKYITDELVHIFMDTDNDEEFEGFDNDDKASRRGRKRAKSMSSEEDSDEDTGFYSEGEGPVPPRRRSSGLCVAFRFPTKKNSAQKTPAAKAAEPQNAKPAVEKSKGTEQRQTRRTRAAAQPISRPQRSVVKAKGRGKELSEEEEDEEEKKLSEDEEEELSKADMQALNKRAMNIQENKAMLAKLFADLNAMEQMSPLTTPKKKKSQQKKSVPEPNSERRNPSRKARPRDHFGIEEELPNLVKQFTIKKEDLRRLVEVDFESREGKKKRRSKMNRSFLPVEDITQDDLDNVADRAKDKILDKENGSTCHQCRQKTLDTKTVCRSPDCVGVKGQFCGPCLRNRYGEDVRTALLDPTWECPICRAMCNCSLCRKREGRCATGALTRLAKHYGHGSVRDYLDSLQKQLS